MSAHRPAAIGRRTQQVAAYVKRLRQARGWSLQELSDRLARTEKPTNRISITKWENGYRARIDVDELCALAEVFEMDPAELLGARCDRCNGNPPAGFVCGACGLGGQA